MNAAEYFTPSIVWRISSANAQKISLWNYSVNFNRFGLRFTRYGNVPDGLCCVPLLRMTIQFYYCTLFVKPWRILRHSSCLFPIADILKKMKSECNHGWNSRCSTISLMLQGRTENEAWNISCTWNYPHPPTPVLETKRNCWNVQTINVATRCGLKK